MTKKVCLFPQYKSCGKRTCPLYTTCSKLPYAKDFRFDSPFLRINTKNKSFAEIKAHERKYAFYNNIWGDRDKRIVYRKKYYEEHRDEILAKKRKEPSPHLPVVQEGYCNQDCEHCIYEDCILPEYETRKEYMDLYYTKFHDRLLKQKQEYRIEHRTFLANSEKMRNYQKRGYITNNGTLIKTDNTKFQRLLDTDGYITFFSIGAVNYISFITKDRNDSFRIKIAGDSDKWVNLNAQNIYKDTDGNSYIFTIV